VLNVGNDTGDEFGKWEVPNMGNDAGDDFGKFPLEGGELTSKVLGDEFGKMKSDEDRKWFSPGFSGLMKW